MGWFFGTLDGLMYYQSTSDTNLEFASSSCNGTTARFQDCGIYWNDRKITRLSGKRSSGGMRRQGYKKKKGQNRNSAPFKIQYPMKNQDESNSVFLIKQ